MSLRGFALAWLAVVALRLAGAVSIPLSGDEAYYWMWTHHLALGYHDHPPMVAWIVALATALCGEHTWAVRLPFVLMGAAMPWVVWRVALDVTGEMRAALWSGALMLATPLFTLAGLAVFPDCSLLLACALFLWCGWRASHGHGSVWWLAAGVAAGVAALSKLTGLYLLPSFFVFLAVGVERRWLRSWQPYAMIAAMVLVWSPFLYWNATHHWDSFAYQYGSRLGKSTGWRPALTLRYLLLSAVAVSPLLYALLWWAWARVSVASSAGRSPAASFLLWMVLPMQGFFLLCSLRTNIGLHWTAPALVAMSVAFGWWVGTPDPSQATRRVWAVVALVMAAGLSSLLFIAALSPATLLLGVNAIVSNAHVAGINKGEPLRSSEIAEILGYPPAARHVHDVAVEMRAQGSQPFFITTNYALSSALAFYSGELDFHVIMGNRIGAEYDRWDDYPTMLGRDAIYVDTSEIPTRVDVRTVLHQAFDDVQLDPPFRTEAGGVGSRTYYIARCHHFSHDIFTAMKTTQSR
jgi:hypothetical protein